MFGALVRLADCHQHLGQLESASSYLDEALAMDAAGIDHSTMRRSSLYRVAMELSYCKGDIEKVHQYALQATAPEFIDELVLTSQNFHRLQARIAELEQHRDEANQHRATLERMHADSQARAERKIQFLQVAFGVSAACVAILVLSAALVYSRFRLAETRKQLSSEIQCSLENQEIREHLEQNVHRLKRMESLGSLASGVAHDFNNLLVGVICNAELLRKRMTQDDFSRECVGQLIQAAEKAAGLSRQMLAYAGKQSIEKAPHDLNQLVQDLFSVLQSTVGEHVKISLQPNAEVQVALCDATQIEQVILNLVTNARDASPQDAILAMRTGRETIDVIDEQYLYGSRLDGGTFAFIEVQDSGSGVPQAALEHIFEPFYSDHGSGRGLGLAVVYGIVEAHDGLIRVTSKPNEGTTIRVLLPLVTVDQPRSTRHSAPPCEATVEADSSSPLVLVADDEPTVLSATKTLLRSHNWEVLTVSNGRQAVEQLLRNHQRIWCLLLDVVMPEMGAGEVLAEMNRASLSTPVILMSGFSEMQVDRVS